jgi:hypothetical protein
MKQKLLIVYNTCGILKNENVNYYIATLNSLLEQANDDHHVVISGCLHRQDVKTKIKTILGNRISYSFIDEKLPVNVTFNKTVQKAVEKFGNFKGYLFIDSGINFHHDRNAINKLFDTHCSGDYAMTASRTDTDAGTFLWFNEGKNYTDESGQEVLFQNGDLEIPIGKTVNLHCQIFDHSIYENFDNKLIPDIFASHCTESVFSYLCAAVNKKFIVTKNVVASHLVGMDGPSAGFRPEINPFPAWQHTFLAPSPDTILKIISDPEAFESGLGYEECQNILPHNKEKYTKEGKCIDQQRLRDFIKENLFLKPVFLDYNKIQCDFT